MTTKNKYRIKLEIKLKYKKGLNDKNYILVIKVLKKDKRFDVSPDYTGEEQYSAHTYISPEEFGIISNNKDYRGSLELEHFNLPNKKFLNRNLEISFISDLKRKEYLKKLHKALIHWASNSIIFKDELKPKFKAISNKWYIYVS